MNKLQRIIIILFHLLFILTPLFFTSLNEELFEFNKMLMTYAFAVLIMAFWIIRMAAEKRIIWKRTPFDIPIGLFVLTQILSTIFSINPHTSLFGYYTRFNGGLLSVFSYVGLFYAFCSNVPRTSLRSMLRTLLFAGIAVALYAIPEHFGHSPSCLFITGKFSVDCWVQTVQSRIFGTFGQPNWLAAYMDMLIPLALIFLVEAVEQKPRNMRSILLYSTTVGMFVATLLFTQSRSGLLALVIGMMMFGIATLLRKGLAATWKTFAVFSAIAIILALCFGSAVTPPLVSLLHISTTKAAVPASAPAQTTAGTQLESGGTESGAIRQIVWKGAVAVWKRYPIFGSGVETFAYSYYKDRPMAHNLVSEWDFLYNKAHNEFLNYLATTGALGFLAYCGMLVFVSFWFLRQRSLLADALLAGYIALTVSNFLGFSTVIVSTLFFLYPAFAYIAVAHDTHTGKEQYSEMFWFLSSLCLFAAGFLLIMITTSWRADVSYATGKKYELSGLNTQTMQELQKATALVPSEPVYHDELSVYSARLAVAFAEQKDSTTAAQLAQLAVQESNTTLQQNAVNANFYKSRARLFIYLAQLNPSFLAEAKTALQKAEILAPTDPKLVFNIGIIEQTQGNLPEAMKLLNQSIEMKPNYEDPHNALAIMYEQQHQYAQAIAQEQYILDNIAPGKETVKASIVRLQKLEKK